MTNRKLREQAQKHYNALVMIATGFYSADEILNQLSESDRTGLEPEEYLAMSYENIQRTARVAILGAIPPDIVDLDSSKDEVG